MTKKDKAVLIDGLNRLSADIADLASLLEGEAQAKAEEPAPKDAEPEAPAEEEAPAKEATYEEARAVLAEKSRTGFRAEVKAILTAHGLKQLSDAKDAAEFAAIIAEAEVIGNG